MSNEYMRLRVISISRSAALEHAKGVASQWFEVPAECISARIVEVLDVEEEEMTTIAGTKIGHQIAFSSIVNTNIQHQWDNMNGHTRQCDHCQTVERT